MDTFSVEQRSALMRSIKGKDTEPELLVRRSLFRLGYRFRLHVKKLPGTPDIVLRKFKTIIFVNGCFWHGHSDCRRGSTLPKSKTEYWSSKINSNKERDARKTQALEKMGWRVIVIYQCELTSKTLQKTIEKIVMVLNSKISPV